MGPDPELLIGWGRANLRDLPWRSSRDPWAVLVSEVMAQQTGVDRVVPKWHAFLDRWPDPAACAEADLAEVLVLWSGLGYPRRARNLHATARVLVDRHGGRVPADRAALLELPGVGPYTASAVLAFAFEHDVGVVDTNIARVLARWGGRPLTAGEARRLADDWVPHGQGWWWNQSLMELGARCCRPRSPRCEGCPLAASCRWLSSGRPEPDPAATSALVSGRQAPFDGSHRQVRGRVLAALHDGPVAADELAALLGDLDGAEVEAAVRSLTADRLVSLDEPGAHLRLG